MGDQHTILDATAARHLLKRTGFGALPKDVAYFTGRTRGQAVDELLAFKPKGFKPGGRYSVDAQIRWAKYILKTKTPLMEKLVLFWHDHFSCAISTVGVIPLMGNYVKTLHLHCKGNLKAFVKAINVDAAMMIYLDTARNLKAIPNENYARELQELFTLGVTDENGVPNYTQDDIVQIARAFTGWTYAYRTGRTDLNLAQHDFMADYPTRGPKVIYTTVGGFGPGGRSFTTRGEGVTEIDEVTDIIFEHVDSDGKNTVARRTARRLLEYFAHPAVDVATVDAVVAASNFATPGHPNQWSIQAVLREILTHDVCYETAAAIPFGPSTKKSVRWPIDLVIGTLRQLQVKPKTQYYYVGGGAYGRVHDALRNMGQALLDPPSVFGWDWETGWISSATLLARYAFLRDVAFAREGSSGFHPDRLMDMNLTVPSDIVDAVLEVLAVPDQFDAVQKQAFVDYLTEGGAVSALDLHDEATVDRKLRGLFALVMQSPQYQVH